MQPFDPLRLKIFETAELSEEKILSELLPLATLSQEQENRIEAKARSWVENIRAHFHKLDPIEKLIHRIRLTDKEGLALMALAEALPRIPDDETADILIHDKLQQGNWRNYLENYPDLISKLAWFGLTLGKDLGKDTGKPAAARSMLDNMKASALREAMRSAMQRLGNHFVLGQTIETALAKSLKTTHALERMSFDMLGEAARTANDAQRYFEGYKRALLVIANSPKSGNELFGPALSVKLSALHPRYEWAQHERVEREILPLITELIETAAQHKIGLTLDAEEADKLDLSLNIIEKIMAMPALKNYAGFGVAVQAYQKRAPALINWLLANCQKQNIKMTVRLVKGAYWDKEIKLAQERGLEEFPVYTRKCATDIAYLACARMLLEYRGYIMPQFATHNIHTLLTIHEMAGDTRNYEIQRLYGMGAEAHKRMMDLDVQSCVYAPVGPHDELLSYLIRRLMENSANSSFVNQLYDNSIHEKDLAQSPFAQWHYAQPKANPAIASPAHLFGATRINSKGADLFSAPSTQKIEGNLKRRRLMEWQAAPVINGIAICDDVPRSLKNPANHLHEIGKCFDATETDADKAIDVLQAAFPAWQQTDTATRADLLERLANRMEDAREDLLSLLVFEAGKTIPDAISELREAIDFCRYYANQARIIFGPTQTMKGINGEDNILHWQGRGVFVCISPWNFPLAIMLGQVAAALVAGNCVAIKPAEQTPLIAAHICTLMRECGFPKNVFALLTGNGNVGAALVRNPHIAGVVFTGSTETARHINIKLAERMGAIIPFIAETGGINAIIADSSALPEQIVDDVITSAFGSAGQRCSAARLLCVQDSIADNVINMLAGAIAERYVGAPENISCDIGPVIDAESLEKLEAHISRLRSEAKLIAKARETDQMRLGTFGQPQAWEIPHLGWLTREIFGPILHVVRFKAGALPEIIETVNALGYGLTGGLHSRIDAHIEFAKRNWQVGNLYINRSIIGAVVESQPFGGSGLSGTGPKAGGPHYLLRFATERSISTNLMAAGGDVKLLGER